MFKCMIPVILQAEAGCGELIEVCYGRIHGQGGSWIRFFFQQLLHHRDMPVIDMGICNHMDQFTRHKAADLGKHVEQYGVLSHIPAVSCEHVLGALVQDAVQGAAGNIEGHTVGAWVQVHLMKVVVVIDIGHDAPA